MKTNGWHFMHGGREIWRATKREIADLASQIANKTGRAVTVRPGRRKKPKATAAPTPAGRARPARKVMKPNPDPLAYLGVWREQERHRQARADYLARTKGTRLAKTLGRRPGAKPAAPAGLGKKTGKFAVDAKRGSEKFTLYRASRQAAEALASEFLAAGYKVRVIEA